MTPSPKCGALTRNGKACRNPAVPGSNPPRCAAHQSVLQTTEDLETMALVIQDLSAKQRLLSAYLDSCWKSESLPLPDLAKLMAIHSQNAIRLARLLRDKRALSGQAADGIAGAIAQALDELATEWGVEL